MREEDKDKRKAKRDETEEERRARKEREHAEKKARKKREEAEAAAAAAGGEAEGEKKSKRKETEEERRARKERERAERKAKEKTVATADATSGEAVAPATGKRGETEEERKLRKERERAERKAREKEEKERATAAAEAGKVNEGNTQHHHHRDRHASEEAEPSAPSAAPEREHKSSKSREKPTSERDALVAAIEEENRAASRSALQSRDADAAKARREAREEEKESAELREQRKREQREERRRRKERERGGAGDDGAPETAEAEGGPLAGGRDGVAAELRRQGYRGQFERDLARATALRRLVDLDDTAAILVDIAPQTEYDMYIRNFTESGKKLAAVQVPDEEDMIAVGVQAERVKTRNKGGQVPEDLGLYPEQYADRVGFGRAAGAAEGEAEGDGAEDGGEDAEKPKGGRAAAGGAPSVDAGLFTSFLSRVYPVVGAILDENMAAMEAAGSSAAAIAAAEAKAKAVSSDAQGFSAACTSYTFKPVRHRPVLKARFSPNGGRTLAGLYGPPAKKTPASSPSSSAAATALLDQYPSVLLLWNTYNSTTPERVLASFSHLTCLCFSPSRPHLVYAGAEDGSVCVWDLREPDRHHIQGGRVAGQPMVVRLPSFTTSWQTDNHAAAVRDVTVMGGNGPLSSVGGGAGGSTAFGGSSGASGVPAEQLASLDTSGILKYWAVSDAPGRATTISTNEYGLHVFSSVRLTLAGTVSATRSGTDGDDLDDGYGLYSGGPGGGGGISDDSDEEDGDLGRRSDRLAGAMSSLTADGADSYGGWLRMPCTGSSAGCSLDFCPSDPSHFVVAAAGGLRHRSRFGLVAAPAVYGGPESSPYVMEKLLANASTAASAAPCPTCVRYSTRDSRVLVAGYGDGTVRLFLRDEASPQLIVPVSAGAAAITEVRTVSSVPWLTWVLDETGTVYLLDHAHRQQRQVPRVVAPLSQPDTGACLCLDVPWEEKTLEGGQVAVGFEKGLLQVHTVDARKVLAPAADRDLKWL